MNFRAQLFCLWCGPAMLLLFWLGLMQLAQYMPPPEGTYSVLTYTQIGSVAIGSLIGQGSTWIFEAAAYRLDDTPPVIVRAIHDLAWFTFLAPWPSFTVWCVALALAIFADRRTAPSFPRWAAFLSLWTGLLFVPACLIFWFKVGPFSWNGIIAFYVPVFIFSFGLLGLRCRPSGLSIASKRQEDEHARFSRSDLRSMP